MTIKLNPNKAFAYKNHGDAKQALGDLDGALADINEAIRLNPVLPQPLINGTVIWRAKGDFDRAIADAIDAMRLAKYPPTNIMTPPGNVVISAYVHRALAYEAKGDYEHARPDFAAALDIPASDAQPQRQPGDRQSSVVTAVGSRRRIVARNGSATPAEQRSATSAPSSVASADSGRRMALVISNGAYAGVKALPNPPNDARAIAKCLREIGFAVTEGIDLDRATMQKMTRDFLRDAARAQIAFAYYASHGVQIDGHKPT